MRVHTYSPLFLLFLSLCCASSALPQQKPTDDLNVALMQSTFLVSGPAGNQAIAGTVFLLGRVIPNKEGMWKVVLVTANHVLAGIDGNYALVVLRHHESQGNWIRYPVRLTIRDGKTPLWTKNPDADVAVAYVTLPVTPFDQIIPIESLADDKTLTDYNMTPGTELNCLGYPYGKVANEIGFPFLRTGAIASYPLTPTSTYKTFLFDFRVFGGNSGGPVYFSQAPFRGNVSFGPRAQFIVGLVTEQEYATEPEKDPLSIGVVIPAAVIKNTIEMLPAPESPKADVSALEMKALPPNAKSLNF